MGSVEQHCRNAFPTPQVYGGTRRPTIQLITCGGSFDRKARHYDDIISVYATAA